MAELPNASVRIDDQAGAFSSGVNYAIVLACVALNADSTPRVYASAKSLTDQHGYSQGASYVAKHITKTRKPVIFVGMPIATPGFAGSFDSSGITGTCRMSVSAGANGYLEEVDAKIRTITGGTIGTAGIVLGVSMDDGRSEVSVRLGTATSYTVPHLGIVIAFGAGTLVAGDVFTFRTHAPMWDSAGLTAARTALAAQTKQARTFMVIGDLPTSAFATNVTTEANAYDTSNKRFIKARVSVKDRRLAKMSRSKVAMTGSPTLTFAEVGATGDTVTRSAGSWLDDGFAVGYVVTIAGSVSNNVTGRIAALTATVLTFDTTDLAVEGPVSNCTVVGSPSLTFAEVGASADTLTRSHGSWIDDGFAVGDKVKITGTASNNVSPTIAALTATVMTMDTTDLNPEEIASHLVTIVKDQTMAAYVAAMDAAFVSVDNQKRIDLSIGRGRKQCPISGWLLRRPASWHASVREYEHDIHIPCWRKADGPLDGVDLTDGAGNVVEFDERIHGGALAARFTCMRTWANGPNGAFMAHSLTRAPDASLMSRSHNMDVVNLACAVTQAETENAVGQVLVLQKNGKATETSLGLIEGRVNTQLQINLLQDNGEGPRASSAVWRASRDDILNVANAKLNGTLFLNLNGTLETIDTAVLVQTAG